MTEIPRIVEKNERNMLAALAVMVFSLSRPVTQAITVFPGRGEKERLQYAVKLWEDGQPKTKLFLVAGTEWELEETTEQPTLELLQRPEYGLKTIKGVHIQHHAHCTPDQTNWVVSNLRQNLGIGSISLVATPYHLLRAYLTLVKQAIKEDIAFAIFPAPVPKAPNAIVPEDKTDAWELIDGEMERILRYQEKGDVATLEEMKDYLRWHWRMTLPQN